MRRRAYPIDAVQQVMRGIDLSFEPPGTVYRHAAAWMFGVVLRTFLRVGEGVADWLGAMMAAAEAF